MSKLVKGVKKVFKKIVKVIKKVAPIILAAAAIYFTAGAALGITSAAGWGGAAASVTSSLGTGILGSTVTGALTSAGYGAAIGGVVSAASGGSFSQGAKTGAITGAITGGLKGAFTGIKAASAAGGVKTTPLPDSPGFGTPMEATPLDAAGNPIEFSGPYAPGVTGPSSAMVPPVQPGPVVTDPGVVANTNPSSVVSGAEDVVTKSPGILGKGGWLERNPEIAGGAIKGIGQGLMAAGAGDADIDFLRERQRLISSNYAGTDPGANYRDLSGSGARKDRYDPASYGSWEYQYDPVQGRIIKVPVGG